MDHLVTNFRRSIIIAQIYGGLKSQDVEKLSSLKVFVEKWPLIRGNFSNFVPKAFIATLVDVLCSNLVKFGRRQLGKVVSCLSDKKQHFSWLFSSRYCADRAEICQGQHPRMYSERFSFHPNRFTFGGLIPERVNTIKTCRSVSSIRLKPSLNNQY